MYDIVTVFTDCISSLVGLTPFVIVVAACVMYFIFSTFRNLFS